MAIYPSPNPPRPEPQPGQVYYFFEHEGIVPLVVTAGTTERVRRGTEQQLARVAAPKVQAFAAPPPPAEVIPYLVRPIPQPVSRPPAPRVFSVTPDQVVVEVPVPLLVAADTDARIRKPHAHAQRAPLPGESYYFFDALIDEIPLLVAPGVDARTRRPLEKPAAVLPAPKVQPFVQPAQAPEQPVPSVVRGIEKPTAKVPPPKAWVVTPDQVAPEQPVPYFVRGVERPTTKVGAPRVLPVTPDPVAPGGEIPLLVAEGVDNRARAPVKRPLLLERRSLEAQLCGPLSFIEQPQEPQVSLMAAGVDSRTRTPVRREARGLALRSQIIVGRVDQVAPEAPTPYFARAVQKPVATVAAPRIFSVTPDPVVPEVFPDLVAAGVGNRSRKPQEREFGKYPAAKVQAFTPVAPAPEEIPALIAAGVGNRGRKPTEREFGKYPAPKVQPFTPDITVLPWLSVAGVDGRTRRPVPSHSTHGRRSPPRVLPFEAPLEVPPVYGWGARGRIGGSARDPWGRIGTEVAPDSSTGIGTSIAVDRNKGIGSESA